MRVIGLDLSTSTIGYCVIETHAPFRPKVDYAIVEMNHFSLKNVEGLFNKVDIGFDAILKVMIRLGVQQAYIEEPVQAFTPGMSSAATIILLAKFNALISYHVRNHLGDANLFYVKPTEARKTCSLVMTTKAKAGGKSFARMAQMMGMGGGAAPGGPAIPPGLGGSMPDMEQLKVLGGGKMPDLSQLSKLTGGPGGLPGLGNLPPGFNPFKKN